MRMTIFMTIFLIVFALVSFYISKRFVKKLDLSKRIKRYINIFLIINFIGIIGYLVGRYYVDMPNSLYFFFSVPIGVTFLFFCTAIIYDISRVTIEKSPLTKQRRKFFKKSLDIFALFTATALTARSLYEARFVQIEQVKIALKNLKKSYKIVQLSDIHIGGLIDAKFIGDIVNKVNSLQPDLVVITGDLIDIKLSSALDSLEKLKDLKSTYGTYFIVGNHEYFHNIEGIISTVKSLGITVLENENVYIGKQNEGFTLAGVYDVFGYRVDKYKPDLKKALKNKEIGSPTILLAHQPRYIEEVKEGVDLVLSGHTHGGQLYPFKFLVQIVQPYISGLHRHRENLQIYVNKGTGFWGPPMRLGATSEITSILIEPEKSL